MELNDYRQLFEQNVSDVFSGWNSILEMTSDCREAAILLFSQDTLEIKEPVLKYLDAFADMYPKVIILSSIDMDEPENVNSKVIVKKVSETELNRYLLYAVSTQELNVRNMSMKVVTVRDVHNLVGFKGADLDTIVCRGIYGIVGEVNE